MKQLSLLMMMSSIALLAQPEKLTLVGDWKVQVEYKGKLGVVDISQPSPFTVKNERYDRMADYRAAGGGWTRGTALQGVKAQECTTRYALKPETLVIKSSDKADAVIFEDGKDYQLTPDWATVGRLPDGRIQPNQPFFADYIYVKLRIDAIVLTKSGDYAVRLGIPHPANPEQAELQDGDTRLANIWLKGDIKKLTDENLFPILENEYPEKELSGPNPAHKLLPKTIKKLESGEPIKILAWGDSVTVGTFVPDWEKNRWQNQFVTRLKARYPRANIELVTEAWGGRNTDSYLAEPPGSRYNYQEKVLGQKPDLIVSEFVNDSGFNQEKVDRQYGRFLKDFKEIGAEWIILTPHYVRPDWMGLNSEKNIDEDPRPYVHALRKFAQENQVALADASLRYGRLWRQGIPHSSLMMNAINHPNTLGMKLFADALMELFK